MGLICIHTSSLGPSWSPHKREMRHGQGCEVEEILCINAEIFGCLGPTLLVVTFPLQDQMSDRAGRGKATGFQEEKLPLAKTKEFCSMQAAPACVPPPWCVSELPVCVKAQLSPLCLAGRGCHANV